MKSINKLRKRKGVSPVIATVILVAVAITVSVAVAYWMGGIAGQYTKFEKVEIQSSLCAIDGYNNWEITIELKNSGTATANLASVYVNDVPAIIGQGTPTNGTYTGITNDMPSSGLKLESGVSGTITIWIYDAHPTLSSGTTVNIKIHSASGMDYIKLVELV